jgi:hypothetical protein
MAWRGVAWRGVAWRGYGVAGVKLCDRHFGKIKYHQTVKN